MMSNKSRANRFLSIDEDSTEHMKNMKLLIKLQWDCSTFEYRVINGGFEQR